MKSIVKAAIFIALIFSVSSCGSGGKDTLHTHEIDLPNGVESKLPIPKDSKINMNVEKKGKYGIMFSPGLNYPESVEFFSQNISSDDWEIEETISEKEEGDRESRWVLKGHNVKVRLKVSTFGGKEGTGTSGFYSIVNADD